MAKDFESVALENLVNKTNDTVLALGNIKNGTDTQVTKLTELVTEIQSSSTNQIIALNNTVTETQNVVTKLTETINAINNNGEMKVNTGETVIYETSTMTQTNSISGNGTKHCEFLMNATGKIKIEFQPKTTTSYYNSHPIRILINGIEVKRKDCGSKNTTTTVYSILDIPVRQGDLIAVHHRLADGYNTAYYHQLHWVKVKADKIIDEVIAI